MGCDSVRLQADLEALGRSWPELAGQLAGVDGLTALLEWAAREGLPVAAMDVIAQDEYTHDAVLPWNGRYLVFGVT